MLESLIPQLKIVAINDAQRVACGAPDFAVSSNASAQSLTVGYAETKDLDTDLGTVERSEQLKRYRRGLGNLVLTDYLEFRWYVDSNLRQIARLGTLDRVKQRIVRDQSSVDELHDLLAGFLSHQPPPITRAKELAERLARPTHMIRNTIATAFAQGQASSTVRGLHQAFAEVLVPDLPVDEFADMFAQTLTYGLFAARVNHDSTHGTFKRLGAASEIPRTNPFLRNLFEHITGLTLDDESFIDFVDDLVQILATSDMESILRDFGRQAGQEDPVVHFYETFLAVYDPDLREKRGVYYTPEPVVSYIVRSVDYLLKKRFGLMKGLADPASTEYAVSTSVDNSEGSNKDNTEIRRVPKVLILDPATGTGTFLYKVISLIREQFMLNDDAGMWSSYVREQLLPRLFGFELLMAPYAVAHLKLGMQLSGLDLPVGARPNWRYDFESAERLNIFLTNTLEESIKQSEVMLGQFISQEANAAAEIKREMPIMVVLGNPPYSGHSSNPSRKTSMEGQSQDAQGGLRSRSKPSRSKRTWIGKLIEDYKKVDGQRINERNPKWLQDDYVKFIRFGQWRVAQSGEGVLAFITNNGFLKNPTFLGMRQSLLDTFTDIYLLDLHGSVNKGDRSPDGALDESVFDIRLGTSIAIFVKAGTKNGPAQVHHADLWGKRNEKYDWLAANDVSMSNWEEITPSSPKYRFKPINVAVESEYNSGWDIKQVMQTNSVGITTSRDAFAFDFERSALEERISDFLDPKHSDDTVRTRYFGTQGSSSKLPGDTNNWQMARSRSALQKDSHWRNKIAFCLYRPFDSRWLFYHPDAVERRRWKVMKHILKDENIAIATTRAVEIGREYEHVFCTKSAMQHHAVSLKEVNYLFPLYLYPSREGDPNGQSEIQNLSPWPDGPHGRRPNLSQPFVSTLELSLGWTFVPDGRGNLGHSIPADGDICKSVGATFGPEDVIHYIYALLHAPSYRSRYAEFLEEDFPRVPLTTDTSLFATLAKLGAKLVGLHTLDVDLAPGLKRVTVRYPKRGSDEVAKAHPKYLSPGERDPLTGELLSEGRVYISASNARKGTSGQYFEGVPPEVWEFHIGGYQVCEKWLKDRRGRTLSNDDLNHYRRIIVALQETIWTMEAIDDAIPGWPLPNEETS